MTNWLKRHFAFDPDVRQALKARLPVVALESTVITHGLPYPENRKLASDLEGEIREQGCTPATIAMLDGKIWIGLNAEQLDRLASAEDMQKISVRDIAFSIESEHSGGTTVSGTLAVAQAVGIKVFATGGIGGVHRQAPFDVSTDLTQLATTKLVVVCAGAKAILDIPATLEVLETYGVPVIGYQTDEFPAFYSTSSGRLVSARLDTPEEIAITAHIHWDLGLSTSILVAVPPPQDLALTRDFVEPAIRKALNDAEENQVTGKAVSPYLLRRVSELTGGLTVRTNLALLRNNARVAAKIAHYIRPVKSKFVQ